MTTRRRKTEGKKKDKCSDPLYDPICIQKQEDSMHFTINLQRNEASSKLQIDKNIDPAAFQSNTKLNFILTPQLQSQHHNTVPLIPDESIFIDKKPMPTNPKKQSSVSAKTRNSHSGFLLGCLTSRGKKSEVAKQFISRQTNSNNISKYVGAQMKENINEKQAQEANSTKQPLSDLELRKKQLNEKLQMLSSQKVKPPTPFQESIDSCNVVNSSSEFSETNDQGKKNTQNESPQEYNNVQELEMIPILDYNNEKEDTRNEAFKSEAKNKYDPKEELISDSYGCLKSCTNVLSKIKEISKEMSELRDDNDILEDEKILRWHISVGMFKEFTKTINLDKLASTMDKIEKIVNNSSDAKKESVRWTNGSTEASSSILYKKYEKQIDKLKEENSKLANRNKELEEAWKSVAEPLS